MYILYKYWGHISSTIFSRLSTTPYFRPQAYERKDLRVVLGQFNRSANEPHRRTARVKTIYLHEGFVYETRENDIALLQLNKPVRYSEYIQSICLPKHPLRFRFGGSRLRCLVMGWGYTDPRGGFSTFTIYWRKTCAIEKIIPISNRFTLTQLIAPITPNSQRNATVFQLAVKYYS